MANGGHFEKKPPKCLWAWYLMNRWLDRIKIWCSGSLGISNYLINFWEKFNKNKMADGENLEKQLLGGGNFFT